ncbi:Polysaccharide deacetylase [Tsuneonella dongtanensis]|uniref:Polysaccharide deacetylase n=1 Tax=Tsuneonella dongtanensis TaxID=692370 RepID=A0A1B2ABD9_9SPHN|nr:polysaccharide deacetylase family protein [Tsuneonella dongtanensis]ANY19462.1 Polysaccharide deacetylase [Tsuneonella dongtanensis]
MTVVYITIDTEYAFRLPGADGPATRAENFARSIACDTPRGAVGTSHQMDVLDANGLKGVFFVDPMPALLWGTEAIADVVVPIVARGHDVQLHCHTEWLEYDRGGDICGGRTGRNLKDFSPGDQLRILAWARATLMAAGAPPPVAFRAGNYGASDSTLDALATLGLRYDSSHCPALSGVGACAISLGREALEPQLHHGVVEMPAACIASFRGRLRHGQITALSLRELLAAVRHARDEGLPSVTLVSHSFELLSRDRRRINRLVARRFARFCKGIAGMEGVRTGTFSADPPATAPDQGPSAAPLPHGRLRGAARVVEQVLANAVYSRSLRAGA